MEISRSLKQMLTVPLLILSSHSFAAPSHNYDQLETSFAAAVPLHAADIPQNGLKDRANCTMRYKDRSGSIDYTSNILGIELQKASGPGFDFAKLVYGSNDDIDLVESQVNGLTYSDRRVVVRGGGSAAGFELIEDTMISVKTLLASDAKRYLMVKVHRSLATNIKVWDHICWFSY